MRVIFQIALLILYITASNSSIYSNVKGSLTSYLTNSIRSLRDSFKKDEPTATNQGDQSRFQIKHNEAKVKKPKAIIRIFKAHDGEEHYARGRKNVKAPHNTMASRNQLTNLGQRKEEVYRLDPVLNNIRRGRGFRRQKSESIETSDSSSSSMELRDWKNEWKEHWVQKKIEAINETEPKGDVINMVAARPWGVPCGDPNQHDMPWGTCMLAMQCDAEYRIYRGDFQCGRTKFVCCALAYTNYDMYQGFDVSFADSDMSTDSDEKKNKGKGSKERKRKKKIKEKKRRKKARQKRKKKIKKNIKKIIREIRKILNRQYRNGTSQRKKKTKQLKKFIKDLKKRYKHDRKSVKDVHEIEMVKIDAALMKKINEIRVLNQNFIKNATFKEIVINGTISRSGARMLVEAYPELVTFFTDNTRRSGKVDKPKDYLDYDIEYGMLYF